MHGQLSRSLQLQLHPKSLFQSRIFMQCYSRVCPDLLLLRMKLFWYGKYLFSFHFAHQPGQAKWAPCTDCPQRPGLPSPPTPPGWPVRPTPNRPSLGEQGNIPGVCCQILQLGVSQLPVEISDFIIKTTLCETTHILLALYFLLSFSGNKIVTEAVI